MSEVSPTAGNQALDFFTGIAGASGLSEIRAENDHRVQFVPLLGTPYSVTVTSGQMTFEHGRNYRPDQPEALYITEVVPCLGDIFAGRQLLGEAIFHHKLQIPGYRNKEPEIAAFSKLLRFGVWQLIAAAEILRPAK